MKRRTGEDGDPKEAAMTFEEIAEALGCSSQAVFQVYHRAIRKLRESGCMQELRDLAAAKERAA